MKKLTDRQIKDRKIYCIENEHSHVVYCDWGRGYCARCGQQQFDLIAGPLVYIERFVYLGELDDNNAEHKERYDALPDEEKVDIAKTRTEFEQMFYGEEDRDDLRVQGGIDENRL